MDIDELKKHIIAKPENHYQETECDNCGYLGHRKYACKLLSMRIKQKFTKRARNARNANEVESTTLSTSQL